MDWARFTSDRERRLWLWAVAVVLAIYSTLGLARTLAGALRASGLLGASFLLGALLVAAAIVTQGLRARPRGAELGIVLGVTAVYLLMGVRMASPAERTHLIEYGVLALILYEALGERMRRSPRPVLAPASLALVVTVLLGWLDEGIQALLPNRVYDMRDVLFNALAAVMAVGMSAALALLRQSRGRVD